MVSSAEVEGPHRPEWETGLIVGRFDPPHLGHGHLVTSAAMRCGRLAVFVNSGPRDAVPGELRAQWLAGLHPDVTVIEVRHDLATDFGNEDLWRRWMDLFRSAWPFETGPHVVASSDPYVDELARRFGADAYVVDSERVTVPISATLIRSDPEAHLDRVAPVVREWIRANWLSGSE
jgi:HTH-type transcriptional repressor of NAD biosynthesis genes